MTGLRVSASLTLPLDYATKTAAILAQRRKGKRLWIETPLPTPTGWTTMGAVRVGELLLDETGSPCAVTEVHPAKWGDAYRVRFSDGEEIVADADHLWLTWTRAERLSAAQRRPGGEARWGRPQCRPALPQVRTTRAIRDSLLVARTDGRTERNHSVPTTAPLDLPEVDLPVDPYLLGVWLGDGTTTAGVITTADGQIVEEISRRGYEIRVQPSTVGRSRASSYRILGLERTLRELGVLGHKHVPLSYHRASLHQRLEVVQGLMDSDGGWALTQVQFAVTSEELADDLYELVVSLGMKAVRSKRAARLNGVDHGTAYSVKFSPTLPVFRLDRKADKLRVTEVTPAASRRFVAAVEPTMSVPMRCIAVDSPSNLFLAGTGMVPTHNTYTASVVAEEMVAVHQPFVVLDPTGAWWGLRSSADGTKVGLPVVILGGQHGDVPLDRSAGRYVAELVVDEPGYYVLDFSLFESGAAEKQFATEFAERLYRRKAQPNSDFPLHLFVDEADRFVPQRITNRAEGDARMLGAFEAIVRRGGLRGLGTTLISQRAAVVNKNVLEQLDLLIMLRTVGPNDQRALGDIVSAHGTPEQKAELLGSLASLELGEAWVWEPGDDLYVRVKIRARRTLNSSATPKAGERRIEPRRLAEVDLDAIKERMAASIEKVAADDPRELRRQIAELRRQLDAAARPVPVAPPAAQDPVPYFPAAALQQLLAFQDEALALMEKLALVISGLPDADEKTALPPLARAAVVKVKVREGPGAPPVRYSAADARITTGMVAGLRKSLSKDSAPRRILAVLAQHGPMAPARAAFMAKVSATKSTLRNALSTLRGSGYIEDSEGGVIAITPAGMGELGDYDPLPTGAALLEYWRAEVGQGKVREIFEVLLEVYPTSVSNADLAAALNIDPGVSTLRNGLSTLRGLGVVEGNGASPALMEAIGR